TNVVAIAAGFSHSVALRKDGFIALWGTSSLALNNIPSGLEDVVTIAAGSSHCLALQRNGTVVAWGSNTSGQTNVPFGLTNVVAVAGGNTHSLALLNDGSPYIARQPWTQTISSGMTVDFETVAMGIPPFHYQWQINGTNMVGATDALLSLTNTPLTAAGNYRCVVSNSFGTTASAVASLTVLRSTPQFVPEFSGLDGESNFNLYLTGLSGHGNIIISTSTNLTDWLPILTNPPVIGSLLITNLPANNSAQRFYRMQEQ
ncbi:MAG: hypothetical protein ABJC04_05795, partial [Verrucomicrobiota bacterium]